MTTSEQMKLTADEMYYNRTIRPSPDQLRLWAYKVEQLEAVAKAAGKVAKLMQSRLDDKPPVEVSNSTICEWLDELDDSLTELEAK